MAVAALVLAVFLTTHRVLSPTGRVIFHDPRAPWIMADLPVSARLQQWKLEQAPATSFLRRLRVERPAPPIHLDVRALGEFEVVVSGVPVPRQVAAQGGHGRGPTRFDVSSLLRPGENEIHVQVRNERGPALLSARLEGPGLEIATDPGWLARLEEGPWRPALNATDLRPHPDAGRGETPLAALRANSVWLGLIFAGASAAFWLFQRFRHVILPARPMWALHVVGAPRLLFAALAAGWVALFIAKFRTIPIPIGFDAASHLRYLRFLFEERSLPLATDGFAMYHPPLFYVLSAAVAGVGGLLSPGSGVMFLKLIPFLSGLGIVWITGRCARKLFPERRGVELWALAFAGVLPMNLYVASYFSNESLHAVLGGSALLVACGLLLDERLDVGRTALVSALLGLALLTKYTGLAVAAVVLPFVGGAILLRHGRKPAELLPRLAALALPLLILCGWFYARNVAVYGRPLVPNWDLPGSGRAWWSQPGFHTPAYYLSFGESLVRPYFAGFTSFWDALYSTLWGDGMLGGRASFRSRHPAWNYEIMAAGYLLALPATFLLLVGLLRGATLALFHAEPRRRAALGLLMGLLGGLGFGVFYTTLSLPYFGQAKAFYMLAGAPVLALCFALGAETLDGLLARRGWGTARAFCFGWLATLFLAFYLSFAA